MAFFYERYSTWKGRSMHLEDLIVKQEHRNKGVGKALYAKVLHYAHEQKFRRVSWEVLDWNQVAIDFYVGTGAKILDSWKVVHMDEPSLEAFVQRY
jgi:ribosomal protein S18 acetylase RimI-like enzyme